MSTLSKPFTFSSGTFAVGSQVNSNFDTIFGWINNGNAMWSDGSVAFTNVPTGPSADPATGNQFTRKAYVDNFSLEVVGTQGSQMITNNPTNLRFLWQGGTQAPTTNSNGIATITFPTPFPNGLGTIVTCGDAGNIVTPQITGAGGLGKATAGIRCFGANGVSLASQTVRVYYIAIGW